MNSGIARVGAILRPVVLARPVVFSDLHYHAQQIESYTYAKLAWSKADCKRMQEYENHLKAYWKDIETWKAVTDEQIERMQRGEGIDPKRLTFQ